MIVSFFFFPQKVTELFTHSFQRRFKKLMTVGLIVPTRILTLWNGCRRAQRWVGGAKAKQASADAESSVCQWC